MARQLLPSTAVAAQSNGGKRPSVISPPSSISASMFFTGKLYSREVISQKQRELCAVASLTVLNREHEVHAHIHAALNVGATRQEVAEVIFQQVTYGGMPVVVEALEVFRRVLEERGEWEA